MGIAVAVGKVGNVRRAGTYVWLERRRAGIGVFGGYVAPTGRETRIVSRYRKTSSA